MEKDVDGVREYDADDLGVREVDVDNYTPRRMTKRYTIYGGYSVIRNNKTTVIKTDEQKVYVVVSGIVYMVENIF